MNNKKKSIGRTLLIGCAAFVFALCVLLGVFGFITYYNGMISKYQTYLRDVLQLSLSQIDNDDLKECISTKSKSASFEESQEFLNQVKENYDLEYIYIIKPLNTDDFDNVMDVMAGITEEEKQIDEAFYSVTLGNLTGDFYSAELAKRYLDGMHSEDVSYFANKSEFGYEYTGILPIKDSSGQSFAVICADVSMNEILGVLKTYVEILIIVIVVLASVALLIMYNWLHKRVIDPLERLEKSSASFVESNRSAENPEDLHFDDPQINTGDEMQSLSNSLTDMFVDMKNYMTSLVSVTKEKERIGSELAVATKIQADMLPRIFPAFPERPEFDLFASMNPAKEVGGDFYDFFMIDENKIGLVIADVAGKGVPAALFMVISKTLLKNRALMGGSPAEIIEYVNDQLNEGNDADMFVTIWFAILDVRTGKAVAVNAGHEHPAIYRKETGRFELDVYRHSPICGTMPGLKFRENEFELKPGDRLFVYTDGVPEATSAAKELYGTDRMLEALNRNTHADAKELLANVRESVNEFVGEADQFDDLTMLAFYYKGPENKE